MYTYIPVQDALRSSSNTVEEQKEQVRLLNEDYQRLVQRENHALISKVSMQVAEK